MTHHALARLIFDQRPQPRQGFDQRIACQLNILTTPLQRVRPRPLRRVVIIAMCLALACTTALGAANPSAALDLLHRFLPDVVQALRPVNKVCENEGIRLEIVSAAASGSVADIYFTLQDLTGARLDETTSLTRSRLLHLAAEGNQTCKVISYDSDTNTVHLLTHLSTTYGEPIGGEKMRFTLKNIASQRKTVQAPLLDAAALAALPQDMPARPSSRYSIVSRSGNAIGNPTYGIIPTLAPRSTPVEKVSLINAGYTHGELHIQLHLKDAWINGDKGSLYLVSGDERIRHTASLGWRDGNDMLFEYIFPLTPAEASAFTLEGEFIQADECVQGNWEVFFPLNDTP